MDDEPIRFGGLEDKNLSSLIRKDVERTLQEYKLFHDETIRLQMEEILFIWAKEHSEFKYQQGMNEILGVIFVCLTSELVFKN